MAVCLLHRLCYRHVVCMIRLRFLELNADGCSLHGPGVHVRVRLPNYMGIGKEGVHAGCILCLRHVELNADGC